MLAEQILWRFTTYKAWAVSINRRKHQRLYVVYKTERDYGKALQLLGLSWP